MLQIGGCGKFVEDFINRLAATTKNPFISDSPLDLLDAVESQGKFVRGGKADRDHVSAIVSGHIAYGKAGDASIHLKPFRFRVSRS
jgi:hypothetical protein